MKFLGSAHFLGLVFGDRLIQAAEVARDGAVIRTAEYVFPTEVSLETPEALGAGLREFLVGNRFTAPRAIAGLPARWLLTRSRELPPMSAALAGDAVRMGAERDLSTDLKDLVLDFAGEADLREARRVLLVAASREQMDRVEKTCRTAGLRLIAVTSTALTLARAAGEGFRDGLFLSLSPGSAEVLVQRDGAPISLRHFPIGLTARAAGSTDGGPTGLDNLGNEIRRVLSLLPGSSEKGEILFSDGIGAGPEALSSLGARLGLPARPAELPAGDAQGPEDDGRSHAPASAAVVLALGGARRDLVAIDFLHSRCMPLPKRRIGRKTLVPAALVAVLVFLGGALLVDLQWSEAELAGDKLRLADMAADIKEAEEFVKSNKSLVLGWYDARPHPLDLLRQVTLAFPEEGKVWAVSFSSIEGRKGTLSGKAVDQKSILTVLDRLKADPLLSDVMLSDMREAGGGQNFVSFALTFTYKAPE